VVVMAVEACAFEDDDEAEESTARSIALADSATALGAETFPQSSASLAKAAACFGRVPRA
jgi:hypothetical protein